MDNRNLYRLMAAKVQNILKHPKKSNRCHKNFFIHHVKKLFHHYLGIVRQKVIFSDIT